MHSNDFPRNKMDVLSIVIKLSFDHFFVVVYLQTSIESFRVVPYFAVYKEDMPHFITQNITRKQNKV